MKKYTGPLFIQAVKPTESGDYDARRDAGGFFFFLLQCGHRSVCKERRDDRGWLVSVPRKAETRPCDECRQKCEAEGKPIPRCFYCRGHGFVRRSTHHVRADGSASATFSQSTCPACRGRTTPAVTKAPTLAEDMGLVGGPS